MFILLFDVLGENKNYIKIYAKTRIKFCLCIIIFIYVYIYNYTQKYPFAVRKPALFFWTRTTAQKYLAAPFLYLSGKSIKYHTVRNEAINKWYAKK